ncbi:MAG TPA: 6-phosphogluconolactonase [Steroidobacteraceae bacterium]|nr:6-phosphogluconolactonase [Steroidobacteraceae bacterium]
MAKVHHCRDYQEMSREAAARVIAATAAKSDSLLCAPTGNSPAGLYQELIRETGRKPDLFGSLRIVKLDEWLGVPASDAASCEHFLRSRLLEPLAITAQRYISFDSETGDPSKECARISAELKRQGPIDLCILGLGKNGHIGLIEPGRALKTHCHVAQLSEETLRHAMMSSREPKPAYGMTLGIGDILRARKIVLLVTGQGKERVIANFLEATVTTDLPATFLWLHPDVEVFLDDSSG